MLLNFICIREKMFTCYCWGASFKSEEELRDHYRERTNWRNTIDGLWSHSL